MSVKSLVEFLFQSGDLTSTFLSMERANLGSRIHRMLQKEGGESYQSEVFLKLETILDEITFEIEGRADGIITSDTSIIIDEIKTTSVEEANIHEDMCFTHWAQAYCYAYIYAFQQQLPSVIVQLTYYQIDTEVIIRFQQEKTMEALTAFYLDCLQEYKQWALLQRNFETLRNKSIKALDFPFTNYRKGQRELAVAVYRTIIDQDVMFAQAPTGIGKTVSTLFPAIKAIREKKVERIFYLCAKNITASVARDTIALMQKQGLRIKCTNIIAKDKMCMLEERNCDPEVCPYAKGYYNRVRKALYDLLQNHDVIDQEVLLNYAKTYMICPFELSLDATLYSDIIICDYNYVFDPRVYLKRFFTDPGEYVFLIDEAHNMVDRARSMYSAELHRSMFMDVWRSIDKQEKKLRKLLQSITKLFLSLQEACDDTGFYQSQEPFATLITLLNQFQKECDLYLQKEHVVNEEATSLYFEVLAYLRIADYYDDHFISYIQKKGKDVCIKQYCLNPNRVINHMLNNGLAAIFFSATLTPIRYFTSLLLEQECEKKIALPSPFDPQHSLLLINNTINTRYKYRDESLQSICDMIAALVQGKTGNYIIFFPSYAYLKQVSQCFMMNYPDIALQIQDSSMNEEQKQAFLMMFHTASTITAFCVLGGMFSEGIDLKGDTLLGVGIVGVGLPQINNEQNMVRDYFNKEAIDGYAYAYVFPGMNKVLQAAGRVIRSLSDRGVILLMDERYTTPQYRSLFPEHMTHYQCIQNSSQLQQTLSRFWKGANEVDEKE